MNKPNITKINNENENKEREKNYVEDEAEAKEKGEIYRQRTFPPNLLLQNYNHCKEGIIHEKSSKNTFLS